MMRLRWIWLFLALLFPVAAHAALPCAAYPNTLTNGTLADANQVMANFNTILNCVNSLAPLGTPVVGTTSNVRASLATAGTTITVAADSVVVGTTLNGSSYLLTSYSQSFNGASVGAGGMDVGSLPSSSYVALYAIYNPTAPAVSILGTSCAASCPTVYSGGNMPAGYTASALLTTLPTNGTPAIKASYVKGKTVFIGAVNTPTTTSNIATPTSASISTAVPPNAIAIGGSLFEACGTTPGAAGMILIIGADANLTGQQELQFNCQSASITGQAPFSNFLITTSQSLFWEVTVAGTGPQALVQITQYQIP